MTGFLRVYDPRKGSFPALLDDGAVFDISGLIGSDVLGLIRERKLNAPSFLQDLRSRLTRACRYQHDYEALWRQSPRGGGAHLQVPLSPPEVWGVGVSYRRAAELHEEDVGTGLYAYVFQSERPEIFFKGTARHCVGHGDCFTIRGDSQGTMVEAELACVFDSGGDVVAYMIANDVTAWDIEKESPLFLSYAKIFNGSCVLGPMLVPAHTVEDPLSLNVECLIERDGRVIYKGEGNTRYMKRSLSELGRYLNYCNAIPDGTTLCTGTAVGIPNDLVVQDGDKVGITIDHLGSLHSVARRWPVASNAGGLS